MKRVASGDNKLDSRIKKEKYLKDDVYSFDLKG